MTFSNMRFAWLLFCLAALLFFSLASCATGNDIEMTHSSSGRSVRNSPDRAQLHRPYADLKWFLLVILIFVVFSILIFIGLFVAFKLAAHDSSPSDDETPTDPSYKYVECWKEYDQSSTYSILEDIEYAEVRFYSQDGCPAFLFYDNMEASELYIQMSCGDQASFQKKMNRLVTLTDGKSILTVMRPLIKGRDEISRTPNVSTDEKRF